MDGSSFLYSFLFDLSCSALMFLIRSFDAPSLILCSTETTSRKKGVSVSLIFLNIVTVCGWFVLILCWFIIA